MAKQYFSALAYDINYCENYYKLRTYLNNLDYIAVILDAAILKGNLSSFIKLLTNLERKIPVLILLNNETSLNDLFKIQYPFLELLKKPFLFRDIKEKLSFLLMHNKDKPYNININIPLIEETYKTKKIFEGIKKVINNNFNVLITGENGTGKKQIAQTINNLSSEKKNMIEFSYVDYSNGDFEKLISDKMSLNALLSKRKISVKDCSNNIYFKDIDSLPMKLQLLLFNFFKKHYLNKNNIFYKKRIISTSSKNIRQSLQNNNFSNELFYFLDMYNIFALPLRDRLQDIPVICNEIIIDYNNKNSKEISLDENCFNLLESYFWPGNITQLRNFILRCCKLCNNDQIDTFLVKEELSNEFKYIEKDFINNWKINFSDTISRNIRGFLNNTNRINAGIYHKMLKEFEKPLIIEVLNYTNHNQLLTADILGINRNTLRKKMSDYDIRIAKKTLDNESS
tara:strand:- start:191 stop:1555 length:1365 start_codon:yes stop_codon:yes gene_type:complete